MIKLMNTARNSDDQKSLHRLLIAEAQMNEKAASSKLHDE